MPIRHSSTDLSTLKAVMDQRRSVVVKWAQSAMTLSKLLTVSSHATRTPTFSILQGGFYSVLTNKVKTGESVFYRFSLLSQKTWKGSTRGAKDIPVCDSFCQDFFNACKNEYMCYRKNGITEILTDISNGSFDPDTKGKIGKKFGDAGYRSRYLPHAKRALYHLSYTPWIQPFFSLWFEIFSFWKDYTIFKCEGDYTCERLEDTPFAGNGILYELDPAIREQLKAAFKKWAEKLGHEFSPPHQTFCQRFSSNLYDPVVQEWVKFTWR